MAQRPARAVGRRVLGWLGLLLLGPLLLYLAVALLAGLLPVNSQFRPVPEEQGGVPVYLRTNGVHADLVLPALRPHAWSAEFPRAAIVDLARVPMVGSLDWIAFGWGDRGFYLSTPTWADLRPAVAWHALTGQGPAAMRVEYLRRPADYAGRWLWLSANQYLDLVAYVRAGFVHDAQGRPRRIDHPGYFATDAFFEGTGHYSPVLTSNEWVRRGLSQAGVRTALWSPFDDALLWQAERAAR